MDLARLVPFVVDALSVEPGAASLPVHLSSFEREFNGCAPSIAGHNPEPGAYQAIEHARIDAAKGEIRRGAHLYLDALGVLDGPHFRTGCDDDIADISGHVADPVERGQINVRRNLTKHLRQR